MQQQQKTPLYVTSTLMSQHHRPLPSRVSHNHHNNHLYLKQHHRGASSNWQRQHQRLSLIMQKSLSSSNLHAQQPLKKYFGHHPSHLHRFHNLVVTPIPSATVIKKLRHKLSKNNTSNNTSFLSINEITQTIFHNLRLGRCKPMRLMFFLCPT